MIFSMAVLGDRREEICPASSVSFSLAIHKSFAYCSLAGYNRAKKSSSGMQGALQEALDFSLMLGFPTWAQSKAPRAPLRLRWHGCCRAPSRPGTAAGSCCQSRRELGAGAQPGTARQLLWRGASPPAEIEAEALPLSARLPDAGAAQGLSLPDRGLRSPPAPTPRAAPAGVTWGCPGTRTPRIPHVPSLRPCARTGGSRREATTRAAAPSRAARRAAGTAGARRRGSASASRRPLAASPGDPRRGARAPGKGALGTEPRNGGPELPDGAALTPSGSPGPGGGGGGGAPLTAPGPARHRPAASLRRRRRRRLAPPGRAGGDCGGPRLGGTARRGAARRRSEARGGRARPGVSSVPAAGLSPRLVVTDGGPRSPGKASQYISTPPWQRSL